MLEKLRSKVRKWKKKWWYSGDIEPRELEIDGEPPYRYTINNEVTWQGQYRQYPNSRKEIAFNLYKLPEDGICFFLIYIELEELTHWADEEGGDNHTEKWRSTLMEEAAFSLRKENVQVTLGDEVIFEQD